jgi:uncharacterized protein YjbI with pentapeptide repeats
VPMNQSLDANPLRVFLESETGEKEIDLTKSSAAEVFRNDLVRHRLTGTIPSGPDFSIVNFVACELYDIVANEIDFSECDFKDTFVKGAVFSDCTFDGGTFATTFFADTEFHRCTFYNLAAYSCDFRKVQFVDCNLTNLLIKSSEFSESRFRNCITSNKICEISTLFDTHFESTPIQFETITNNFGLRKQDLKDSIIRSGRAREDHQSLTIDHLLKRLGSKQFSSLENLTLEYFCNETLLNGSVFLDEALDLTRWTRIHRNPGSFVELLDKFGQFLTYLYEKNDLTAHPILLLHHVTSTLTSSISRKNAHRISMSLGGLHLILSRIVEEFLGVLQQLTDFTSGSVTFLAEGPTDKEYFQRELQPWIEDQEVVINRVERNSPLIVEFIAAHPSLLLALLGVFLATRTKLEISRLKSTVETAARQTTKKSLGKRKKGSNLPALKQTSNLSIFSVSAGIVNNPNPGYELRLLSVLPGSLLVDLRLNFSTMLATRLRAILLNLLLDSSAKRS